MPRRERTAKTDEVETEVVTTAEAPAEQVETQAAAEEPVEVEAIKLEDLTVAELKELADQEGVDLEGATLKADIVETLATATTTTTTTTKPLPLGALQKSAEPPVWSGPVGRPASGKPVATFGSYTGPLGAQR